MNDTRSFLISVLPLEFDEGLIHYSDAVAWSRSNQKHHNVLLLTEEDVYQLENIWTIINDINNSMIGIYEDSWVFDQESRIKILQQLKNFSPNGLPKRQQELLCGIIRLFEVAVQLNRNVYFLF